MVSIILPRAVTSASLARLDCTSQILATAYFDYDILPALIQDSLDFGRNIDDLPRGNDFIVSLYIAIVHFLVPEGILDFSICLHIVNLTAVKNPAFSAERRYRASVGLHRSKDGSGVIDSPLYVARAEVPIDSQ